MHKFINKRLTLLIAVLTIAFSLAGCGMSADYTSVQSFSLEDIPESSDTGYVFINDNEPEFTEEEYTTDAFEAYSPLDYLGRCGPAYACLGRELMPTEERESISHVHPSGWQSVQYDIVDGGSLYNRSHLIGFQMSGENDTEENLITGTRYMNAHVMLPFENLVADYIRDTGNHVLYRVTPVFEGSNLVASGLQMEALSMEDGGEDICFNVYVYNVQPGIEIDYSTGDSWLDEDYENPEEEFAGVASGGESGKYVLNTNSMKFHYNHCGSVDDMSEHNKEYYDGSRSELIDAGFEPCGNCRP
jgi:DNA-entry nuclease